MAQGQQGGRSPSDISLVISSQPDNDSDFSAPVVPGSDQDFSAPVLPAAQAPPAQLAPEEKDLFKHVWEGAKQFYKNQPVHPIDIARLAGGLATDFSDVVTGRSVTNAMQGKKSTSQQIVEGVLQQHRDLWEQAEQSFKRGDPINGWRKRMEWFVPIFGPMLNEAGDQMFAGDYGKAIGGALGIAANLIPVKAIKKVVGTNAGPAATATGGTTPPVRPPLGPATAQFAEREGIPLEAGERTGSEVLKAVGKWNEKTSVSGERVTAKMREKQAAAMQRTGGRLADAVDQVPASPEEAGAAAQEASATTQGGIADAYGKVAEKISGRVSAEVATPESAGASTTRALADKKAAHGRQASAHYNSLREIEQLPENIKEVPTGQFLDSALLRPDGTPVYREPVVEKMALPVDLKALGVKEGLRPVFERMTKHPDWPLVRQQNSPAFKAIEQLVKGPDVVPLSEADEMLSAIKTLAREQGGVAKLAVARMDHAVRHTARAAGDAAIQALEAGRTETIAKYATDEVLAALERGTTGEPVRAFERMVAKGDTAITLLRDIAKHTPQQLPLVARAWLDRVFDQALLTGKFDLNKAAAMAKEWNALGDATKALLFKDPQVMRQLDDFFRNVQRANERPAAPTLPGEPVRAFNQLISPKDSNVLRLRALAKVAPDIPSKLGRAWLEERLMSAGQEPGQFSHGQRIYGDWNKLGPQTKQLLFGDNAKNLDHFFRLANDISYQGNTSRTAYFHGIAAKVYNPIVGAFVEIPQYALARLLWDPNGTRQFIETMQTVRANTKSAAVKSARLLNTLSRLGLKASPIASHIPINQVDSDAQQVGDFEVRQQP